MTSLDPPAQSGKTGGIKGDQPIVIRINPRRLARSLWAKGDNLWITGSRTLITTGVVSPSARHSIYVRERPQSVIWQCADMLRLPVILEWQDAEARRSACHRRFDDTQSWNRS